MITLPEVRITTLRLYPTKGGFVPLFILFRSDLGPLELPKPLLVAMEPGTTIGGIVQNETGDPIEGVTVGVHYQTADPAAVDDVYVDIMLHTDATSVQTDKGGRWQFNMMPAEIDRNELRLFLSHPDYLSDTLGPGYVPLPITPQPPMGRLRDMTAVMVMKKGFAVTGRVVDANGLPIEGASVAQGSDRFGSGYPSTKTDGEGRFQFGHAPPGEMILTVQAEGYSPDLRQIVVGKGGEPIDFRLERGHTLKGRVLDKAGNPVAGAFVAADTWRGRRSLKWRVDTDAQGRFRWDDAPADEVQIDMGKQGLMSVRNRRMTASDKEYVVTMPPVLRIHGRVVDKETAKPVAGFTLVLGFDWGDGQPLYWDRRNAKPFTEGQYEVTYSEWRIGQVVRIEASGYVPEVSRPIGPAEGDVALDFVLTRGTGPSGTVVLPGGEPAAGVTVLMATPSQSVYISDGRRQRDQDNVCMETGPDGRFSFPAQTDLYVLVFLHEKGYAEVLGDDLTASSAVILQPWGCVQGRLLIGSRPGANEGIRLIPDRPDETGAPRIHHECRTATDKDGRFVFNHIPAGKAKVYREIPMGEGGTRFSHDMALDIKAGETSTVTIGGTGRPVIGRVGIPDLLRGKIDWQRADSTLSIAAPGSPYRVLAVTFKADGSFVADDIPAGDYSFRLSLYSPPANRSTFRGDLIGQLTHPFTVSEMPGGRSDEPLDLGVLELQAVGKAATPLSLVGKPLLDLKTLGVSVADANDKSLMVCFIDIEQRPSRRCLADLAKKKETLTAKGISVVVVQVSKVDLKQHEDWIKTNQVTMPICAIEGDFEAKKAAWGVKALPWLILTDKGHKVVAEGFALGELDAKVQGMVQPTTSTPSSIGVTGLVKAPDGQSLANVQVTEFQTDTSYVTDVNGTFVSAYGPSDERRFFFAVDKQRQMVGAERLAPGQRHVKIEMGPARIVSGRVVDPNGNPVVGAQVAPLPMTNFYMLTDGQGRFDVGWQPEWAGNLNEFFLMARHRGRNLATLKSIDSGTKTVEIELAAALTLVGTVEDPNGVPIRGANVQLSLRKGWTCFTPVKNAVTDAAGRYEFAALPQRQEYVNLARAEGFWENGITTGIINTVADREEVGEIILKRPNQAVSGVVVDKADQPVADCDVGIRGEGQPERRTKTDAQGRFTLMEICSGPIEIWAKQDNILYGTIEAQAGQRGVRLPVAPTR